MFGDAYEPLIGNANIFDINIADKFDELSLDMLRIRKSNVVASSEKSGGSLSFLDSLRPPPLPSK